MNDIFPILVSFIYVIAVLLVAYLLESHGRLGRESARKLVHFLVSLWVFVMVYWMDSLWARILGPIAFIFINTFMTLKAREGRAVGMIFFPVALLALFPCRSPCCIHSLFLFSHFSRDCYFISTRHGGGRQCGSSDWNKIW